MIDTNDKPNNRKTGLGSRVKGAEAKGAEAAKAGASRDSNTYVRPNMRAAWFKGFDSVASDAPEQDA